LNRPTNQTISPKIAAARKPTQSARLSLLLRASIVVAAAIGLAASTARPALAADALVNKKAPEFIRSSLDHRKLDLNAYRGKVVLLNFWATWCAPCQLEMPRFVAWQNSYGSRGLQIIGISMDDDPALVRSVYTKLHLNYPVAMGDAPLGELYGGVLGLPVTFLIDRNGEVRAKFEGQTDLGKMEQQLQSLLSHP
jgi:peroxiredoxin